MGNNKYLDNLVAELGAQGIQPPKNDTNDCMNTNIDSRELEIIDSMERITGKKFSDEQRKILEHHGNACILACAGSGKALVNGTGVLTENGYIPIEKLRVHDKVFSDTGEPELVLGVFPQGKKRIYNLTMNDGHVIQCCEDHLWTIKQFKDFNTRDGKKEFAIYYKTVTTRELYEGYRDVEVQIPTVDIKESSVNYSIYDKLFKHTKKEIIKLLVEEKLSTYSDTIEGFGNTRYWTSIELLMTIDKVKYGMNEIVKIRNKEILDDLIMALELYGYHCKKELKEDEKGVYTEILILPRLQSSIICVERTDNFVDMTCIKVSGKTELFLTEHCYVTHNTTISVNLIAKRILTGEIKDVNKLIYTTFSKAGASEMKDRMDRLMSQLGMSHINVQVRTLHSFFLSVITTFGLNKRIINGSERLKMVRQACKDAEYSLKDDDLIIIDNLLSYQMNNLLTNKKLVDSYVNTLEDLTVEKYSIINASFRKQKDADNCMDYDDMQYYLWLWLVKWQKSDNQVERDTAIAVRNYCKAVYTDFYIDEAQDVSKIQFEIIKAIVSDPENKNKLDRNLVFIGDDDQCLLEDTEVATDSGIKLIKDIVEGDKVLSLDNGNIVKSTVINTYSHGINNSIPLVQITTASGRSYIATADHKVMVKIPDKFMEETISYGGNKYVISDVVKEFLDAEEPDKRDTLISRITERLNVFGYLIDLPHFGRVKTNNGYVITSAMSLRSGMIFGKLEADNSESIKDDVIVSVEVVNKEELIGQGKRVYCLNLASNHNYFANGLLTHNCIYQWRGSDPSIILTIGAKFNMQTFVLSTNYRCLNEIVDYAAVGIKCNNSRFDKSMNAFNQGGSVKIYPSVTEDLCTLSIAALNQIKYWISKGDKVSDIAVLARNNFHLAILSNMLLREGIYCNMTEDMKLTKSYMYNDVKDIMMLSEPTWKSDLTAKVLWRLCRYMGANNSRVIAKFQDSCGLTLEDTLGWLLKHFVRKDLNFSKKLNINMQAEQQMQYQMAKLSRETTDDMYSLYITLTDDSRENKIKLLLSQYLQATSFMYKSKDKNRSINGLVKYMINLMYKDGVEKMLDFLRVTEQLEGGKMVIPGEKLTLTTIHSAKGREWKNVIMFACDNVSQPSFDGINTMIKDDIPMSDIFENIDEERRLFYVGNTRAKENLFIITYTKPSIFILEALGAFKDKTGGNDATIVELVGDNQWQEKYSNIIQDKIFDSNSKYFYNPDDYKIEN